MAGFVQQSPGWAYFWYREGGALKSDQIDDAFWSMLINGIAAAPQA